MKGAQNIIDIRSDSGDIGAALSNFSTYVFIFDDVPCASMEGFLQALKFQDVLVQRAVCQLSGKEAKVRGDTVKKEGGYDVLWWQGQPYDRVGAAYQSLLDRAYEALFQQSAGFREALRKTGQAHLVHSIGKRNVTETILTEGEFCRRLTQLRDRLQAT